MKGYKGFDKDLKCKNFQFKIGETFKTDEVKICEKGFHFCENPIDILAYYSPNESRYCEVEGNGKTEGHPDDSKIACSEIHVKAEVSLSALIGAGMKFVFDRVDWSKAEDKSDKKQGAASATGYRGAASATGDSGAASATGYSGAASATGDRGAASATGYRGAASATGDRGAASVSGKFSVAFASGIEGKVKGAKGCWVVLADWRYDEKKEEWELHQVKSLYVDGKKIKADTWYMFEKGKLKEVK